LEGYLGEWRVWSRCSPRPAPILSVGLLTGVSRINEAARHRVLRHDSVCSVRAAYDGTVELEALEFALSPPGDVGMCCATVPLHFPFGASDQALCFRDQQSSGQRHSKPLKFTRRRAECLKLPAPIRYEKSRRVSDCCACTAKLELRRRARGCAPETECPANVPTDRMSACSKVAALLSGSISDVSQSRNPLSWPCPPSSQPPSSAACARGRSRCFGDSSDRDI